MKTVYKVVIKNRSSFYSAWVFDTSLGQRYSTEFFTKAPKGKLFAFATQTAATRFADTIKYTPRINRHHSVHVFEAIGKQVTQPKELWINSHPSFLRNNVTLFWDGLGKFTAREFSRQMKKLYGEHASAAPDDTVLCSEIKLVKEV